MTPESDTTIPDDGISDDAMSVTDNPDASRYELRVNGELAGFSNYRLSPGRIVFTHTETLDEFSGQGMGNHLVGAVLDDARARGLRVVPRCPFVKRYIDEHEAYQDLVA